MGFIPLCHAKVAHERFQTFSDKSVCRIGSVHKQTSHMVKFFQRVGEKETHAFVTTCSDNCGALHGVVSQAASLPYNFRPTRFSRSWEASWRSSGQDTPLSLLDTRPGAAGRCEPASGGFGGHGRFLDSGWLVLEAGLPATVSYFLLPAPEGQRLSSLHPQNHDEDEMKIDV